MKNDYTEVRKIRITICNDEHFFKTVCSKQTLDNFGRDAVENSYLPEYTLDHLSHLTTLLTISLSQTPDTHKMTIEFATFMT